MANLCLWPQGGHTSSRVALSAAGAPPSPVPRPRSAPWPEADNEVHTLPRASQDLVASFATSALSGHSRVFDKLKAQIWSGEYVSISSLLHDSFPQNYYVYSVTTRSPCSEQNVVISSSLYHLTNGCRASKFLCLFFYFSRNTCQNHTTCSCTSRQFVRYMRRVRTGGRMMRYSGLFVRLTTGGGNRFAGICG